MGRGADGASRAELRRQRITDAARQLFVVIGFHATGMAQLTQVSGVAISQIYRDFQYKEDIIAALVEADCGRKMMYDQLKAAIRGDDVASVRARLLEFLDPSDDRDEARLFAEIVADSGRNARIASIFKALHDQLREHVLAALVLLVPGSARAADRMALADLFLTVSMDLGQYQAVHPERNAHLVCHVITRMLDREISSMTNR